MADAQGFVAEAGLTTPTMLLDESSGVWQHYEVLGQPTVILVDSSGNVVHEFSGAFKAEDVLARL